MALKTAAQQIAETTRRLVEEDPTSKKYPNTEDGARECLLVLGNALIKRHFGTGAATWQIDPSFDGVWMATSKTGKNPNGDPARAIVYMAGYRVSTTDVVRSHSDFETDLDA